MPAPLRLVSWNLWGAGWPAPYVRDRRTSRGAVAGSLAGTNIDQRDVLRRRRQLALGELVRLHPDVVALQEDQAAAFGRHSDYLADQLLREGYTAMSARSSLAFMTGPRVTVTSLTTVRPAISGYPEPLELRIVVEGADLSICNVHLSLVPKERALTIDGVLSHLAAQAPEIVCGDFNEESEQGVLARMAAAGFDEVGHAWVPTVPVECPVVRLDHILLNKTSELDFVEAQIVGDVPDAEGHYASDHLGLFSVVGMVPPRADRYTNGTPGG